MAPEDNPADDVQPTREEWDAYEKAREAVPATESPTPGEITVESMVEVNRLVRLCDDCCSGCAGG